MSDLRTRPAAPGELARLAELYEEWGYHGGILPTDVVFVAERDGACVGVVRRAWEHETLMLRGMYVAPSVRGQGVGSRLLAAFVRALDADPAIRHEPCYGIPFAHLERFYAKVGFVFVDESRAPAFLRERVRQYRAEGHVVAVMRRSGAGSGGDRLRG